MNWFQQLRWRRRLHNDLSEEIQGHLAEKVEELVTEGMPREDAVAMARREFGNVTRIEERGREVWQWPAIENFFTDIHYGLRVLRKSPGFTVVAVLTLALGIGATTAIFSVIDSVLLRPLPYGDPARLAIVWESNIKHSSLQNTVAPPDFLDWQSQNTIFDDMAALYDERDNLTGSGEPEQVIVQGVTWNFFSVLGVNPILGRGFTSENGQEKNTDVVVLSYGLWKGKFGGDPAIVGKTIELNGHGNIVLGVAPRNFDWFIKKGSLTSERPQMWSPFAVPPRFRDRKQIGRFMTVVARLKPDVTVAQAQSQMNTIASRLAAEYPDFNKGWGINVVPLRDQLSGEIRPALLVLFGAVGFVLLIACANVSSLLLARAATREREMAIRAAIGATRLRIALQLLTESALLAAIGGALGAALGIWGTNLLLAGSPRNLLDLHAVPIDLRMFAFAACATLLAGLIFGFVPSYVSARSGTSETLKEGGHGASAGKRRRNVRSAFVVAQMSLALVLLAGSGLLIRSFIRLAGVDPGFETNNLLTFKISLPSSKYANDSACMAYFRRLEERIARLPGVRSVSMDSSPPLTGLGAATAIHILGQPEKQLADLPVANVRVVGLDYFRTMGIPLLAGREFNDAENAEMRHVVIINQAFADKYLQGTNPLGMKASIFMKALEENENYPSEIIGVVGDVRQMGLDTAADPTVYWPHPELVYSAMTILVRAANDPLTLVSAVRNEVHQLDPEEPMASVATMDELLSGSLSRARFTMLVLAIFAGVALALAAVGIYGMISYSVSQRAHEIGIRRALGAQQEDVLRLVVGQGMRLAILGVAIGWVAALMLTRLLANLLFAVNANDPLTFAGVPLLLLLVAGVASYIPARRAMRVDPMIALRYE
jgi:putative ABC transport system permease protein